MTDLDLKDFIGSLPADLSIYYETYVNRLKKYSKEYLNLLNNQLVGQ